MTQESHDRSDQSATLRQEEGRLQGLDLLRGLAALAVCWFHFTHGNSLKLPEAVKSSGTYGWLGLSCFFVISGFVVPLSLDRANYEIKRFHRYLFRRVIRLDPPYVATVALCLALAFMSAAATGSQGKLVSVSAPQILAHLGYVNSILGYEWLNPVFWTLAIEFQFYILIGLCFPLLAHKNGAVRTAAVLMLWALSLIPVPNAYLLAHLDLFLLGVVAFQLQREGASPGACFVALGLVLLSIGTVKGPATTVAGFAAFTFISLGRGLAFPRPFLWLGAISYSLYLLHVPIGGRVLNLATRLEPTLVNVVSALAVAVLVSLFSAFVLYRLVERPAQRWARRIDY